MRKATISMAIFNSYVKLPEGNFGHAEAASMGPLGPKKRCLERLVTCCQMAIFSARRFRPCVDRLKTFKTDALLRQSPR